MNKTEWKEKIDQGDFLEVDIFDWGSSQYEDAASIFETFKAVRKDLSLKDTLEVFEIQPFDSETFFASAEDLREYMIPDEDDQENIVEVENILKSVVKDNKYDAVFNFFKEQAWDLWSAASVIVPNIEQPFEWGQDTGIECALLSEFGLVENEESFKGFDT